MSKSSPAQAPRGVSPVLGTGVGFFIAAAILMASIFLLNADNPILWPPPRDLTITAAWCLFGTLFLGALWGFLWVVYDLVAVMAGRQTLAQVRRTLLQFLIMAAIALGGVAISLRAFYWPWAQASALYTLEESAEPWRIATCGELLASRWDGQIEQAVTRMALSPDEPQWLAAQWVIASTGDRGALGVFVAEAKWLPEGGPAETDGAAQGAERYTRADALWLLGRIVEGEWATIDELEAAAGARLERLEWDSTTGRYRLDAAEAP